MWEGAAGRHEMKWMGDVAVGISDGEQMLFSAWQTRFSQNNEARISPDSYFPTPRNPHLEIVNITIHYLFYHLFGLMYTMIHPL